MIELRHLTIIAALVTPFAQATETRYAKDAETGIESWESLAGGVRLSLTQMLPDQARAFFIGRGFEPEEAEHYAASCVFMTILSNEAAPAAISYNLAAWRAVSALGLAMPPKLKEDWLREWEARKLTQSKKIAFEWSQLPSRQRFEPGDWNQGMTTFAAARGSRFDLVYRWTANGRQQKNILKGVRCANDVSGN